MTPEFKLLLFFVKLNRQYLLGKLINYTKKVLTLKHFIQYIWIFEKLNLIAVWVIFLSYLFQPITRQCYLPPADLYQSHL